MTIRSLTDQELRDEVIAGGWVGEDRITAFAIALAESVQPNGRGGDGADADALNRNLAGPKINTIDHGVWQINTVHKDMPGFDQVWATLKYGGNPGNAKLAYAIFKRDGWTAWQSWDERAANPRWAEFVSRARAVFAGTAPLPYPLNPQTQVFGSESVGTIWKGYQVISRSDTYAPVIRKIQAAVGAPVTGVFTDSTAAAVKIWQGKNALEPHGIVGQLAWARLGLVG